MTVSRVIADPHQPPFPDETFDIVGCGPSFHHLTSPRIALVEMQRLLRPGGRAVLEDIITSEQTVRGRYQDRLERLRDRSHPGYRRLSQIVAYAGENGLRVRRVQADLSGLRIRSVDDAIFFTQKIAWVLAEKPS